MAAPSSKKSSKPGRQEHPQRPGRKTGDGRVVVDDKFSQECTAIIDAWTDTDKNRRVRIEVKNDGDRQTGCTFNVIVRKLNAKGKSKKATEKRLFPGEKTVIDATANELSIRCFGEGDGRACQGAFKVTEIDW